MRSIFTKARLARRIPLVLLCSFGLAPAANAQFNNYFTYQVFSSSSTATAGTFNGNSFTIAGGGVTVSTYSPSTPGDLPAATGFPGTGPSSHLFKNTGGTATSTLTFTNSITPADHIYIQDIDHSESVTFTFKDSLGNTINPSGFTAHKISTTFPTSYTITKNVTSIQVSSGSESTDELLTEIIPNAFVKTISMTIGTTAGGFELYFGRNRPQLSQSLSYSTINQGQATTISYSLNGIYNNPEHNLGFTNTLPAGWVVADPIFIINSTGGTVTAVPGANTISLSGLNNSFTTGTPVTTATISVNITNAPGFVNTSCGSSPASSTNSAVNFIVDDTKIQTSLSPQCLVVNDPLPVKLVSFTGKEAGCDVLLHWKTALETESKEYLVEHSTDGGKWQPVGRVAAAGFSYSAQDYSFTDKQAGAGMNYYRLRMVDLSGKETLSSVVTLKTGCAAAHAIQVYPNPVTNLLHIEMPPASHQVRIYNAAGQLFYTAIAASGTLQLSVAAWPAGLYQVLIQDEAGNIEKQERLIKQ